MADTTATAGLTPQQWDSKFYTEYFQESLFKGEMGTSENAVIQVKEDLSGKPGDSLTFSLANKMTGAGVTGTATLEGNEEEVETRSQKLTVVKRRNAFRVAEQDEAYSSISLREAGKNVLKTWAHENDRDRFIEAMASINGVAYGTASETQKDAWLTDNADRVLFGAAISNNSGNDHSASLANVDATNDVLTAGIAGVMKRMALTANPKIRPVMSKTSGRRYFCAYVHPYTFRDLKADPVIQAAQRDVGLRMQNEKLFHGGDIEWDGIVFKELDDMPLLSGVGASSADVAPVFFCGAQAVGYGVRKKWWTVEETFDYGDKKGVSINQFDGIEKLRFGTGAGDLDDLKDHGMVTGYMAAVADA